MRYELIGFKWGSSEAGTESGPIYWSADFVTQLTHTSAYTDDDFTNALQAAFDRWESVASIDFEYNETLAMVDVSAVAFSGATAGQASYAPFSRAGEFDGISNAMIQFDTSDRFWAPYGDFSGGSDFYAVALHEIGHVLGLAHPVPDDPEEIMNPTIFVDDLGPGDVAGAQYIYGSDAGDEEAPEGGVAGGGGTGLSDDGGGGGSGGGLLIGLLAAILALIFGSGGAALVAVAGRLPEDEDDDDTEGDEALAMTPETDWLPMIPILEDHDHALCGHSACCHGYCEHVSEGSDADLLVV